MPEDISRSCRNLLVAPPLHNHDGQKRGGKRSSQCPQGRRENEQVAELALCKNQYLHLAPGQFAVSRYGTFAAPWPTRSSRMMKTSRFVGNCRSPASDNP